MTCSSALETSRSVVASSADEACNFGQFSGNGAEFLSVSQNPASPAAKQLDEGYTNLIQDEDGWICDQSSCDRQPLALSTAKRGALLRYLEIVAVW